jgi:hypothetical protein
MEFVEGQIFENRIKRSGRLDAKLALEIAAGLAAGRNPLEDADGPSAIRGSCSATRVIQLTPVLVAIKTLPARAESFRHESGQKRCMDQSVTASNVSGAHFQQVNTPHLGMEKLCRDVAWKYSPALHHRLIC